MRVLLAVDQSEHSQRAVDFLATQKFTLPIELEIISVVMPLPYVDVADVGMFGGGLMPEAGSLIADETEFVQRRLEETAAKLKDRFGEVHCTVKVGSPAAEIRAVADETAARLVVMGAVGHSAVARVLLGSVSDEVATHIRSSALIVRHTADDHKPKAIERVLLAVGMSEQDSLLGKQLEILDLPRSTEIHLVHVMQMFTFFRQDLIQRTSQIWQQSRAAAEQQTKELAEPLTKHGFQTHTHVLEDTHVGETLVNFAVDHDCGLILTGDNRESLAERVLLGSTSRHVLRHGHCSVMIVRKP